MQASLHLTVYLLMATSLYLSPSIPRPRSLDGSPKGVVSIAGRDLQGEQIVTLQCLSTPRDVTAHTHMQVTYRGH
jgi:hypothetical protein